MSAVPYRATFVRLLAFLQPYRVGLIVSIVLAVGSQAAQIALVWVTGKDVIDKALLHRDTHRLWLSVIAILGLGLVRAALMGGRRLISGRQALDVEMDLRSGLYAHMVRLSFGFYDRHQTGQLMSRATVIPLPHPSGASSWPNVPANRMRLDAALVLVHAELGRLQ